MSVNRKKLWLGAVLTAMLLLSASACDAGEGTHPEVPPQGNETVTNSEQDTSTESETVAQTPPHMHSFSDWIMTKAPGCTDAGSRSRSCTCGEIQTQEIAATGHVEADDAAVAPTCTETGLTAGKHCSVCHVTTVPQNVIPALGHKEITGVAVQPTCTETGLTTEAYCSVCQAVTAPQSVIPALGHTEAVHAAVPPTCTESGLTEERYCSTCSVIIKAREVLPATGHSTVADQAVAPTCTALGWTAGSHCSVCQVVFVAPTSIPALGHTPVTDAAVTPTCTETGLTEGAHCSVCLAVTVPQTVVAALGHTPVTDEAVQATCTQTGLTEGSHCTVCSAVITAQTVTPVTDHAYSDYGWTCSMCDAEECRVYNSYNDFYNACEVVEDGNTVRFFYNASTPVTLNLQRFALDSSIRYHFVFGSEAGKCKIAGNGATYSNVTIEIGERNTSYSLMLSNVSFTNAKTILRSGAYDLNLVLHGTAVNLQTTKAAGGSNGESFGAFQIGNGGPGGNGANANPVIECSGMLKILCGASATVFGGDGGNGGNGGNSDSSGSSGGRGGNGGNGAYAIKANDIQVSFANGKDQTNLILAGGRGGSGGSGGKGAFLFGIGGSYAPDGDSGSSSLATNVEVQYN